MFKVPAAITTVDYVGITTAESTKYRRLALNELEILQKQMEFGRLQQYVRFSYIGDNVSCDSRITHGLATATVVIGAVENQTIKEYGCFCCTYGIVAGVVLRTKDEIEDPESPADNYINDESYFGDILVCQKTGSGKPKKIETRTIRRSGGNISDEIINSVSNEFWLTQEIINVPFTDRFPHMAGDIVLVLIMPLVEYRPEQVFPYGMEYTEKQGAWSPEVNKRNIVNYAFEDPLKPEALITTKYVNSTGLTCVISMDSEVWLGNEKKNIDPEPKYTPFRVLPILLDSCVSGYK